MNSLTDMLVGDGIVCQPKTGDATLDTKVTALWKEHVAQAHAADRHSLYALQRISARSMVEMRTWVPPTPRASSAGWK